MTEAHELSTPPSLSLNEAIEAIKIDTDTYPREAIDVILCHREKAIPQLIRILEEIIEDPVAYWTRFREHHIRLHLYALELLSNFQATEAHTTIASFVTLRGDFIHDIFGMYLNTLLAETLFNTSTENCEQLKRLVEKETDEDVHRSIPLAAIDALFLSVLNGKADRVEVINYLAATLTESLKIKLHGFAQFQGQIIEVLFGLFPENHMDLLHKVLSRRSDYDLYKRQLDDVLLDGLEQTLEISRKYVAEHSFPENIHERLLMEVHDDDCCDCGHEHHHHGHQHRSSASNASPQKHALPRNQRLKSKKKIRSNQRQARKKNRKK